MHLYRNDTNPKFELQSANCKRGKTRTQVLELGPRDLEPLPHDPHCILIEEDATDEDATVEDTIDEDAMDEYATDEVHHPRCITPDAHHLRMRITPRCASPPDAHHPRMRITPGASPLVHHPRCITPSASSLIHPPSSYLISLSHILFKNIAHV